MRIAVRDGLFGRNLALAALPKTATGSGQFKELLNKVKQSTQGSRSQRGGNLPASDIAAGLEEALVNDTANAINSLGRKGGFWGNGKLRTPLPRKLEQAGELAPQWGKGAKVVAFELSMNCAVETAMPPVAQIFGDAIRKMTLDDARCILGGGDHAATDFFRRVAGDDLSARIPPIGPRATDSVGVTQKYKSFSAGAMGGMGGQPGGVTSGKGGSALGKDDYVTTKTLDGLVTTIGEQEQSIRPNPGARTIDLLKKVFGAH